PRSWTRPTTPQARTPTTRPAKLSPAPTRGQGEGSVPTSASRLLLLLPTRTYRTEAFIDAATRLGVELVCASERPSTLEELSPNSLVTLDFADPYGSAETIVRFARSRPIDAVVGVDDLTTVTAAAISQRLRPPAHRPPAGPHRARQARDAPMPRRGRSAGATLSAGRALRRPGARRPEGRVPVRAQAAHALGEPR